MKLNDIAYFVEDKISSENIKLDQYVTTDSLLQNKKGRTFAQNLPPQKCSLVHLKKGDVLLGNIRPYLKKIWYANIEGGCSQDVLVLRAKNNLESKFLYALLMQDSFFDYEMKATKGSKMPRGDKSHIINFPCLDLNNKTEIGKLLSSLDDKIALNKRINAKLEQMAKRLYDYWFVQFDFPNADGKPYKSNGGKMVWNEELKREIPEGWEVKSIFDAADVIYGFPYVTEPFDENVEESNKPYSIIRIRDILENSISAKTTESVDDKYKTKIGDLLIGMDGYFHMNFWSRDNDYVNQRIVRIRKKDVSTLILYHQVLPFIKFKEEKAKGSTVGHLSDKDMKQIKVLIPNNKDLNVKFDTILSMMMARRQENLKLTAVRDKLLPLLMNGQVVVK